MAKLFVQSTCSRCLWNDCYWMTFPPIEESPPMCLFFIAKALHSDALLCYISYLLKTPASLSQSPWWQSWLLLWCVGETLAFLMTCWWRNPRKAVLHNTVNLYYVVKSVLFPITAIPVSGSPVPKQATRICLPKSWHSIPWRQCIRYHLQILCQHLSGCVLQ